MDFEKYIKLGFYILALPFILGLITLGLIGTAVEKAYIYAVRSK